MPGQAKRQQGTHRKDRDDWAVGRIALLYAARWNFSWSLEIVLWGVPGAVVCVLGWNLWHETVKMDPYAPVGIGEVLQIDAIAYDWKWLFLYRDAGVASADRLVLPTGRPVELRLTSATALQAFSVPRLGGQIYAMPGMASRFNLRADVAGRFEGLNTQYNGPHFARQRFVAEAVPPRAFESWIDATRAAPPLNAEALARLAEPGVLEAPVAFGGIAGDPFRETVARLRAGKAPADDG
ncbi:hypothetical protein JF540_23985 [Salipiger thiooxidans]|uniref:cytochrome c oxidase subunit II n=1 Tax=Salipiger thiooxidans TaxID=282683 RepID=UPI001A8CA04C|nr:hypothetical protein [Salipiger thiooxidans]MBN8189752.1 hypothetical protein [Salipiger thiooxidans]